MLSVGNVSLVKGIRVTAIRVTTIRVIAIKVTTILLFNKIYLALSIIAKIVK